MGLRQLHDDEVPRPAIVIRSADREDENRLTGSEIFATNTRILAVTVAPFSGGVDFVNDANESTEGWTRRNFLRVSLVGTMLLGGRLVCPSVTFARELPEGRLTLFNVWTDERLDVTYRNETGEYDLEALDDVNHILRCHYTGEVAAIDVRVLEHVNLVQKKFGGQREIHVISGFRSPEYNAILVRSGRRAARNSLHVQGQAIDIQIPGIHPKMIRQAALQLGYGGVGYYPRSKFVHLDSGPFRHW